MLCQLRVEYPGAVYHVVSRGERQEDIFLDDGSVTTFLRPWPRHAKRPAGARGHEYSSCYPAPARLLRIIRPKEPCVLWVDPGLTPFGGPEWPETAERKAQHLLCDELQKRGWDLEGLKKRRKGDPDKIQIARRLRSQTTLTLAWI
jgi:hypothetical protein